jgi:hypothetical protein
VVSAFVILVLNNSMLMIVRKFSLQERPHTLTGYNASVGFKLTAARFVNSAIIPILVNYEFSKWYRQGGLAQNATFLVFAIALQEPLMLFCDPWFLKRKFEQWSARRKDKDCRLTQQEANLLFKGDRLDMANRLANTANALLVCTFYAPLIPAAPFIGFFGMLFSYNVEKYLLVRRHERPDQLSGTMITFFSNLVPWIALVWALSNYLFSVRLQNEYNETLAESEVPVDATKYALYGLLLIILDLLLPIRLMINRCCTVEDEFENGIYKE